MGLRDAVLNAEALEMYVGISAGAILCGRSVQPALFKGWDRPIPEVDTDDEDQMTGFGFVHETSFFPHYTPEWRTLVDERAPALGHRCVLLPEVTVGDGEVTTATAAEGWGTSKALLSGVEMAPAFYTERVEVPRAHVAHPLSLGH